jgi:pyruvate/2-oxoglutarate dehydrogenase complex dihydrolipoamide acyltransferase (E2) component
MELNMDNAMAARTAITKCSSKSFFNDDSLSLCCCTSKFPDVNSSWMHDFIRKNNHMILALHWHCPEGLIVPVINLIKKSLSQQR